jgi:hypothetical protein
MNFFYHVNPRTTRNDDRAPKVRPKVKNVVNKADARHEEAYETKLVPFRNEIVAQRPFVKPSKNIRTENILLNYNKPY